METRNFTEGNHCIGSRNKATTLDSSKAQSIRHTQKVINHQPISTEVLNFQVRLLKLLVCYSVLL